MKSLIIIAVICAVAYAPPPGSERVKKPSERTKADYGHDAGRRRYPSYGDYYRDVDPKGRRSCITNNDCTRGTRQQQL